MESSKKVEKWIVLPWGGDHPDEDLQGSRTPFLPKSQPRLDEQELRPVLIINY